MSDQSTLRDQLDEVIERLETMADLAPSIKVCVPILNAQNELRIARAILIETETPDEDGEEED